MQFKTKLGLVDVPNAEVITAARDIIDAADAAVFFLGQEELHAALGRAMEHIEKGGANTDLTSAVMIVGDVRQSIGNRWNKACPHAAQRVRDYLTRNPA